jgi:PKD repeat protein
MDKRIIVLILTLCTCVFLSIVNAGAEDQDFNDGFLVAQGSACSADFSFEIVKSTETFIDVYFSVLKPVPDADYRWSFGDGKGTKKMEPTHRYDIRDKKEFTVILYMTKGKCSDEKTKTVSVKGAFQKETCSAEFVYEISSVTFAKATVKFTSIMNDADIYIWDFGDGSTSTERNPVHTFDAIAIKEVVVVLAVQKGKCYEETSQKIVFPKPKEDYSKKCDASFEYTLVSQTRDKATVRFFSLMKDGTRYEWDFGDGKKIIDPSPMHVYEILSKRKFVVTLKITKAFCSDSTSQTISFQDFAGTDEKACTADFDMDITYQDNLKGTVRFSPKMDKGFSYVWDFGDGKQSTDKNPFHMYSLKGGIKEFTVTLAVSGFVCSDKKAKKVSFGATVESRKCNADFTFEIGKKEKGRNLVKFKPVMTDASSYFWDFGDNDTSDEENPEHLYKFSGKREYTVSLTVRSVQCSDSKSKTLSLQADLEDECSADFDFKIINKEKQKGTVQFEVKTKDPSVNFSWDFGDGTNSDNANPVHTYTISFKKQFNVTLYSKKGKCTNQQTKTVDFAVSPCSAEFTVKTTFNDGKMARVEITMKANDPYAEFSCDFGDGTISAEWNPVHTYNIRKQKNYKIVLRVKKPECSDEFEQQISF